MERLMVGGSQDGVRITVEENTETVLVEGGRVSPVDVDDGFRQDAPRRLVTDITEVYELRSLGGVSVFFLDTLGRDEGAQMLVDNYRR